MKSSLRTAIRKAFEVSSPEREKTSKDVPWWHEWLRVSLTLAHVTQA